MINIVVGVIKKIRI